MIKELLGLFMQKVVEDSIKNTLKQQTIARVKNDIRIEFLRSVAEGYSREVTHNISAYVKSVGEASLSIETDPGQGEKFFNSIKKSLKSLEQELESQGPDSPIVRYLEKRYGRFSESLVGRSRIPVYATVAQGPGRDEPWLNRTLRLPGVNEYIANEAAKLLDQLLSDEFLP